MMNRNAQTLLMWAALGAAVISPMSSVAMAFSTSAFHSADPSADEVLADSVKALGGSEAIAKIKTLRSVMQMTMAGRDGDITVEVESLWSRDGGRIVRQNTMGGRELGTDGKVTWKKTDMGVGPLSKDEAEQLKSQSSMIMHLLEPAIMKQEISKIEYAGTSTFDGRECHRLHFTKSNGDEGDLFYEVKSSLPAGIDKLGSRNAHIVFSDWQEEQGVKFYRTMKVEPEGQSTPVTMKVTKIEINTLEASAFAPPKDLKPPSTTKPDASQPAGGNTSAKEIALSDLTPEQQKKAQDTIENMKRSADPQRMKEAVSQLERMMGAMPEDQRKMLQYIVQEMKKEVARLGG